MDARKDEQRNIGIALLTNISASGPMCCGSRKEAPKDAKMNTGTGFVTSKSSEFVSRVRAVAVSSESSLRSAGRNYFQQMRGFAPPDCSG